MKNSLLKYLVIGVVGLSIMGLNLAVQAQSSIQGSINFDGGANLDQSLPNATAFSSFYGPIGMDPLVQQYSQTGDYLSVPSGTAANFTPFSFASGVGSLSVSPLWTFSIGTTNYSFSIDSITYISQSSNFLDIMGTGMAQITGYAATPGTWTITDTAANPNPVSVTFSSSANVVPEPTTGACMLLGLVALASARFLNKNKQFAAKIPLKVSTTTTELGEQAVFKAS